MLEYQGWATIRESYCEEGEDENLLNDAINELKGMISNISNSHRELGLRYFNGSPRLWIMGFSNHKGQDFQEAVELFKAISRIAPGSYGILSFHDDEDADVNKRNCFQNIILKKGKIELEHDTFLSPCVPTIEEV